MSHPLTGPPVRFFIALLYEEKFDLGPLVPLLSQEIGNIEIVPFTVDTMKNYYQHEMGQHLKRVFIV